LQAVEHPVQDGRACGGGVSKYGFKVVISVLCANDLSEWNAVSRGERLRGGGGGGGGGGGWRRCQSGYG
jgi:hypothetical protein